MPANFQQTTHFSARLVEDQRIARVHLRKRRSDRFDISKIATAIAFDRFRITLGSETRRDRSWNRGPDRSSRFRRRVAHEQSSRECFLVRCTGRSSCSRDVPASGILYDRYTSGSTNLSRRVSSAARAPEMARFKSSRFIFLSRYSESATNEHLSSGIYIVYLINFMFIM